MCFLFSLLYHAHLITYTTFATLLHISSLYYKIFSAFHFSLVNINFELIQNFISQHYYEIYFKCLGNGKYTEYLTILCFNVNFYFLWHSLCVSR